MQRRPQNMCTCFLLAVVSSWLILGCYYTRWDYTSNPKVIERGTWELYFGFRDVGATKPIKEGRDWSDTLFYYIVTLMETDTLVNRRVTFMVHNVALSYPGDSLEVVLEKHSEGSAPLQAPIGAPQRVMRHWKNFGPFRVPIPRPDSVKVEQTIIVQDATTSEEIDRVHLQVNGELTKWRGSHLRDILEGT